MQRCTARDADIPRTKDEVLSLRTTAEIKALLRLAAERERRSVASMVEVLVLTYARQHGLSADTLPTTGQNVRHRSR